MKIMWDLSQKVPRNVKKKEGMHFIPVLGLRYLELLGKEEYECLGQDAVGIERNDGGARAVSPLEETAATNALDGNSRTASA